MYIYNRFLYIESVIILLLNVFILTICFVLLLPYNIFILNDYFVRFYVESIDYLNVTSVHYFYYIYSVLIFFVSPYILFYKIFVKIVYRD